MVNIVKEVIESIRNKALDDFGKVQIETVLDIYLGLDSIGMSDLHLLHIFLGVVELHDKDIYDNKFLYMKYIELKNRVLRLGIESLSLFIDGVGDSNVFTGTVVDNTQLYKPGRNLDLLSKKDIFLYSSGEIEVREVYNLHPDVDIESDTPLLNDYAQHMINKHLSTNE